MTAEQAFKKDNMVPVVISAECGPATAVFSVPLN